MNEVLKTQLWNSDVTVEGFLKSPEKQEIEMNYKISHEYLERIRKQKFYHDLWYFGANAVLLMVIILITSSFPETSEKFGLFLPLVGGVFCALLGG